MTRFSVQAGFTMIELMVVVSLIVILATMGLAQYRSSVTRSKEAVLKEDLFQMRDAIDQYYADKGSIPGARFARERRLPAEGSEGSVHRQRPTWQTVPSEPDPNNPTAEPGIYDVKSGSDATALDGTKYADW